MKYIKFNEFIMRTKDIIKVLYDKFDYSLKRWNNCEMRKKNMHRQCQIILHCQPITIIFSVMSLHLTSLSWYDMEG
jgi:hypothetical protein